MLLTPLHLPRPVGRRNFSRNSTNTPHSHYYSTSLHQYHCAVLYCSTLFLPSHSPKRPKLIVPAFSFHGGDLCSEPKKSPYFIMGEYPPSASKVRNFSKCYVVNGRRTLFFFKSRQTLFWASTNTFWKMAEIFLSVM